MAERSFPIITFDTASVMQLLYSCAYARAAAMDALLIDEPTVMNSLFKYAMTPKRIGSLTEGDPQAFKRAVFLIYYRYQSGFNTALGTGAALRYLRSCINVRDEARGRLQNMQDYVNRNNATFDEGSLSGVLCLRHSMSKRSIYANESKNRHGGQGGIAAHFA